MRNHLKTFLLLGILSAVVVGVGALLGKGYLFVFAALAVLMNVGAYFFSDRIVLRMNGAREVSPDDAPELHRMVEELAMRAGLPKPRVAIIPADYPNAFATGRNPENGVVAVTEGILQLLTPRELRGVLAHELAHIRNRDILVSTVAAGLAAVVTALANATQWLGILGGLSSDDEDRSPVASLALAFVAPIAVSLIQFGISRSREFLADETGARISGDPEALARALEKLHRGSELIPAEAAPATASLFIVNPLSGAEGFLTWFSTHPPVARRVARLREMATAPTAFELPYVARQPV